MARKANDVTHINLAELEVFIKGVNLALKWGLSELKLMTDSATVFCWVNSLLTNDKKIKTHGLGEMLVRRRLELLSALVDECGLQLKIT